jgi:hypothetical protein
MACKLHSDWVKIKAAIDTHMKKYKNLQKPGKFDQDFGPTLDKLAAAYKAKKDADIKTLAAKASGIATAYETQLTTMSKANHWGDGDSSPWVVGLRKIHDSVRDLQAHGQAAKNCF